MDDPIPTLPDGTYPFGEECYSLSDMVMAEAPSDLARLLTEQAQSNGTTIARGVPVELKCKYAGEVEATFFIWWPHGEKMHMLMPRSRAKGLA